MVSCLALLYVEARARCENGNDRIESIMEAYIIVFKYKREGEKKPGPVRQFRIYAGDLDEDGAPDFVVPNEVANDVREYFGEAVYRTVIPRNVRVSEAPSHGTPVLVYDMACAGSQAYLHLAGELIRREKEVSA